MTKSISFVILTVCLVFIIVNVALGCPMCDSSTGKQVRAQLADEHLGLSVLATVVPFVVILVVVGVVHFGPLRFRRKP